MKIKERVLKYTIPFIDKIYFSIFRHYMSEETKRFLYHLSFTFFATGIAAIIMFVVNIFATRLLGPEEFGKYGVIISLGQIITIFTTLGLSSILVKYIIPEKRGVNGILILQTLIFTAVTSIAALLLFLLFKDVFMSLVNIDNSLFLILMILVPFLTFFNIFEAFNKGFLRFKFQAIWQIINAFLIIFAFLLLFFVFRFQTFSAYILPFLLGYFAYSLITIIYFLRRREITFNFSKALRNFPDFYKIIVYAKYTFLGGFIWYIISGLDKIFLNKFIGFNETGLFQAYLTASITVLGVFYTSLINVFFPTATNFKNYRVVFDKIKKLSWLSFLPMILAEFIIISIILKLYGTQYEYNALYVLLFSLACFFYFWGGTVAWLAYAQGLKGVKYTFYTALFVSALSVVINFILIPQYGMLGATIAFLFSMTLSFFLYFYILPIEKYVFNLD